MAHGLILVTGGTGGLGRRVVPRLGEAGRQVRVLSRRPHESTEGIEHVVGDLTKNEGVEAAVDGAEVIVHCAGVGKIKDDRAQAQNLAREAKKAGVRHLVNISVVGADRIPVVSGVDRAMFAYFASQLAGEQAVAESGLAWTNLRATQFHDGFVLLMVQAMAKMPVVPVPAGFRFQPVDAGEVAERLVELALGEPMGQVPDIAGPAIYPAADLLRGYLMATHKRRLLVPVRMPGGAARAIRAGANLAPDRAVGRRTWEQFLAEWSNASTGVVRPAVGSG
ncbi:MAG: SDR family oxidoreductase [Candidatus Dormibacterales bacterium]